MPTTKKRINLTVSDEFYEKVKTLTDRQGVSMASWCVVQLGQILDSYDMMLKNVSDSFSSVYGNCHDKKETD
jgi:hypothetical protein